MAPPNDPFISFLSPLQPNPMENCFDLSKDESKFNVKGVPLLSEVPNNVFFTEFSSICRSSDAPGTLFQRVQSMSYKGGFLGFKADTPSERALNPLGKFKDRNFLSVFRFKTWWSTQWVGNCGSDLQIETQWVLLDVPEIKAYVLIVPLVEGAFRAALNPGVDGFVMISTESGSSQVKGDTFKAIAYVHVSDNPYNIMKEAFSAIRVHLGTFRLLEEKETPSMIDKFGWCTWDAFYLSVDPVGVWYGVNEFSEAGFSVRFLIIDDGWQSVNLDSDDQYRDRSDFVIGGEQMTARLYRLEEGEKFKRYKKGSLLLPNSPPYDPNKPKLLISKAIEIEKAEKEKKAAESEGYDLSEFDLKIQQLKQELYEMMGRDSEESTENDASEEGDERGLKAFTSDLITKFKGLDDIWAWHALCGGWGGVRPESTRFNTNIIQCELSPGLGATMDDLAVDKIVEGGIGLVEPQEACDFYDSMHSYLANAGITGVKVDIMQALEYVCEEYGGRVELAKAYYEGLSKSLEKNFKGTNLLSSMEQCNDFLFLGTKQISLGRVGDDFWFQDPNGDPDGAFWLQGVHMIHCAYNSLWMGQIFYPDWDMFQSDHVCAKFHAGSRAICGGPIYVSDSLRGHDFELLKKLVYPDGTIPKCQRFALPTRDVLFKNPLFDGETILKIWNFNKYGGVIGAFNCQGAGWDPKERRIKGYKECYKTMETSIHVNDIEWDQNLESIQMGYCDEYAIYLNQCELVFLMTHDSDPIPIVVEPSSFEICTFVPVQKLSCCVKFALFGVIDMFNCGGTVTEVSYKEFSVQMKIKGGGKFLAHSSEKPKKCVVNESEVEFEWLDESKLVFNVPWVDATSGVSKAFIQY